MRAFHQAAERHFQPFSHAVGATWEIVCPWIEGFFTPTVQTTIGVYHGHFPNVCVKFRLNTTPAPLGSDEGVFGLDWVQAFVTGQQPSQRPEQRWQPDTIAGEIERLANQFRQFAMPLVLSPATNWPEIHHYVQTGVVEAFAAKQARSR